MPGLTSLGGAPGAAHASSWLFSLFIVSPVLAALLTRRALSADH
jgi:hypothetical protein